MMSKLSDKKAALYNRFISESIFNEETMTWDGATRILRHCLIDQWNQACKRVNRLAHVNELPKDIDCLEVQFILSVKYGHRCENRHIYDKLTVEYANGDTGHHRLLIIAQELYSEGLSELQ